MRPDSSSARAASPATPAVVADQRVQVAVAGVEHVGDRQPVLRGELVDAGEHLGQPGARDHAVLDEVVGREAAHGGERGLAGLPEQCPLRLVAATRTSSEPHRPQIATTSSNWAAHSCSAPSSSTSSAAPRPTGYPAWAICSVAAIVAASIISIAPGTMPACDDLGDRLARLSTCESKKATRVRDGLGQRHHPQPDLGRDAERALGADERAEQVVAGRVELRPTELDHLAVGQHDLQPDHVVGGEAVLEAVRAAGVLGDVAADRADDLAGRVGRVEEVGADRGRDGRVGDARLDADPSVVEVDLEDPGEPGQHDEHAVGDRQRAAGQAGAGAPGDPRHPGRGAGRHHARTSSPSPGSTATAGRAWYCSRPSRLVGAQLVLMGEHPVGADDPAQLCEQRRACLHREVG